MGKVFVSIMGELRYTLAGKGEPMASTSALASKVFPVIEVPGRLWGYKQGRREAFRPERVAFKSLVRLHANLAGVPSELNDDERAHVSCSIYWVKRSRIDWTNIVKIVEDSIFRQDRRCYPGENFVYEYAGQERILIEVTLARVPSVRRS